MAEGRSLGTVFVELALDPEKYVRAADGLGKTAQETASSIEKSYTRAMSATQKVIRETGEAIGSTAHLVKQFGIAAMATGEAGKNLADSLSTVAKTTALAYTMYRIGVPVVEAASVAYRGLSAGVMLARDATEVLVAGTKIGLQAAFTPLGTAILLATAGYKAYSGVLDSVARSQAEVNLQVDRTDYAAAARKYAQLALEMETFRIRGTLGFGEFKTKVQEDAAGAYESMGRVMAGVADWLGAQLPGQLGTSLQTWRNYYREIDAAAQASLFSQLNATAVTLLAQEALIEAAAQRVRAAQARRGLAETIPGRQAATAELRAAVTGRTEAERDRLQTIIEQLNLDIQNPQKIAQADINRQKLFNAIDLRRRLLDEERETQRQLALEDEKFTRVLTQKWFAEQERLNKLSSDLWKRGGDTFEEAERLRLEIAEADAFELLEIRRKEAADAARVYLRGVDTFEEAERLAREEVRITMADYRAALAQRAVEDRRYLLDRLAESGSYFERVRLGFQIHAVDVENANTRILAATSQVYQAMQRTTSDLFFDVVTGKWQELSKLPEQFGGAMLRVLTDVLAAETVREFTNLLKGWGGLLGSAAGSIVDWLGAFQSGLWEVPGGPQGQAAILHPGEMVLPADVAAAVRASLTGGGERGPAGRGPLGYGELMGAVIGSRLSGWEAAAYGIAKAVNTMIGLGPSLISPSPLGMLLGGYATVQRDIAIDREAIARGWGVTREVAERIARDLHNPALSSVPATQAMLESFIAESISVAQEAAAATSAALGAKLAGERADLGGVIGGYEGSYTGGLSEVGGGFTGSSGIGPGGDPGDFYARGALFQTLGPTRMIVGEAGSETVAVVRNPRPAEVGGRSGPVIIHLHQHAPILGWSDGREFARWIVQEIRRLGIALPGVDLFPVRR